MSRGESSAMKALHAGSIRTAGKSAFKVASSTAFAADALRKTAAATVYGVGKNIVFSQTHTHASMTAVNVSITRIPKVCLRGSSHGALKRLLARLGQSQRKRPDPPGDAAPDVPGLQVVSIFGRRSVRIRLFWTTTCIFWTAI